MLVMFSFWFADVNAHKNLLVLYKIPEKAVLVSVLGGEKRSQRILQSSHAGMVMNLLLIVNLKHVVLWMRKHVFT